MIGGISRIKSYIVQGKFKGERERAQNKKKRWREEIKSERT